MHEPRNGTGRLKRELAGYIEQRHRRTLPLETVVGVSVKNKRKFQTGSG